MNTRKKNIIKWAFGGGLIGGGIIGVAGGLIYSGLSGYSACNELLQDMLSKEPYSDCNSTISHKNRTSITCYSVYHNHIVCSPKNLSNYLINTVEERENSVFVKTLPESMGYFITTFTVGGVIVGGICAYYLSPKPLRPALLQTSLEATGWEDPIPEEFIDPIDQMLMDDPIKTYTNEQIQETYDADTLARFKKPLQCPLSKLPLIIVGRDEALLRRIKEFVEEKKRNQKHDVCPHEISVDIQSDEDEEEKSHHPTSLVVQPYFVASPPSRTNPEFICPLTHKIMEDPVTASDGENYEKTAILAYIQDQHNLVSPVTKALLKPVNANKWVVPNEHLKNKIHSTLNFEKILAEKRRQLSLQQDSVSIGLSAPLLSPRAVGSRG